MCGIVGVVVKNNNGFIKKQEDSFFQMLYADALRGDDSTGIIGVEKDTTFHTAKEAISAEWFISQYKAGHSTISNAMWNRGKAYIGHNRKKTIGAVSDATSHPFTVDKAFSLVHNGTLHSHNMLAKTEVDSEALAIHLYNAFEKEGKVKENMEEALGKVYGAYAVAMYHQARNKVYLLRNKERPLSLVEVEDAWFFMSEPLMGAWILARNGYDYSKMKFEHLTEHQIVTFDLDKNTMNKELLVPKKYTPQTRGEVVYPHGASMTTRTGASPATAANKGNPCKSEKDLKKFRKEWVGKRISFWPDDFLEKNFPRSVDEDGESEVQLMGQNEDVNYWHTLLANVDLHKLGIRFSEEIGTKKWSGVVDSVSMTKTGCLLIDLMDGCKPMANSITMDTVRIQRAWRESLGKMLMDDILVLMESEKYTLQPWQNAAIKAEITFRQSITSVDEARARAKVNGQLLKVTTRNGYIIYTNTDGKVFYESAIAVH